METKYKILSFVILGIAFITTAFGGTYLFTSNPFLGYFDSDAIENLQEVKKFKELYPEATRGSVIDQTGIRTVRFTYFEHDTSFVYDGPNKTPNNIVLEILFDSVTKSLLDAELTCYINDEIHIVSETIVESLLKDDCFETDYNKSKPVTKSIITVRDRIPEINVPVYPKFANGVTEIINPEFEHLKYRVTSPTIDDTYLSKNVQQWKDAWTHELEAEYEKYGDDFYTELGSLLIKNEMQYQIDNLGIVNANDDFEVYSGMALTSLPPHISFSAVIFATDENYYRLQGTTHANRVSYYSTTQLQFLDTTEKLSIESIISKPQLITIIPEDGNNARQEPYTLVVHVDKNTIEFFNNTPETIRIQDSGSGRVGEENTLDWMGPIILPYQKATMTFDKPGLIEWDARNAPNLEDPLWWSTHAGGIIVVLSDDMDNFSRDDKARIAQVMLHNSDIPLTSSGSGNAEKVLNLGLDPAVTKMVPNAEEYYLQRAKQLIPFDVPIIIEG